MKNCLTINTNELTAKAIANSINTIANCSVKKIIIKGSSIDLEQSKYFKNILSTHPSMEYLDIELYQQPNECLISILQGIKNNPLIKGLSLRGNPDEPFNDESFGHILSMLESKANFSYLYISHSDVSETSIIRLANQIALRKHVKALWLDNLPPGLCYPNAFNTLGIAIVGKHFKTTQSNFDGLYCSSLDDPLRDSLLGNEVVRHLTKKPSKLERLDITWTLKDTLTQLNELKDKGEQTRSYLSNLDQIMTQLRASLDGISMEIEDQKNLMLKGGDPTKRAYFDIMMAIDGYLKGIKSSGFIDKPKHMLSSNHTLDRQALTMWINILTIMFENEILTKTKALAKISFKDLPRHEILMDMQRTLIGLISVDNCLELTNCHSFGVQ